HSYVMTRVVPHFQEANRMNQNGLLPLETYGQCLDYVVITCVDIVFFHRDQLLIGKRKTYPKRGWWIIGGRMYAGESPLEAVARKADQEANVQVDQSRFLFVNAYSTCFATRQQEPQHHGLHSVNLTYTLTLTDQEAEQLRLTSSEYDEWAWVSLEDLRHRLDLADSLDQALWAIAYDTFERRSSVEAVLP
ncbi:MAG: NUDIX domain-containing protein, partial [Elainellaceae cyanobacterium]